LPLLGIKKIWGGHAFHGFREAQSGLAPPLATALRPAGAFKTADGGKTAIYMLRRVNTREEKGPRSEICSAMVAA